MLIQRVSNFLTLFLVLASSCVGPTVDLEPIRIGVMIPLSGQLGQDGQGILEGAQLAAREINAAGGVYGGRPIELLTRDTRTEAALGQSIAEELVAQGVVAIVGATASGVSLAAVDTTGAAQIPQVSCCSTSPDLTQYNADRPESERYFFRVVPSDVRQAEVLVSVIRDESECANSLAVFYVNNAYGAALADALETQYMSQTSTGLLAKVPIPDQVGANYADAIQMVQAVSPRCIALVSYAEGGRLIAEYAMSAPVPTKWFGTDGIKTQDFVVEANDPAVINGVVGVAPLSNPSTAQYTRFNSLYRASFGAGDPVAFTANEYDSLAFIALGLALADQEGVTPSGPDLRDRIRAVSQNIGTGTGAEVVVRAGLLGEGLRAIRGGSTHIAYQGASGTVEFNEYNEPADGLYELWRYDSPDSGMTCTGASQQLSNNRGSFCTLRELGGQ